MSRFGLSLLLLTSAAFAQTDIPTPGRIPSNAAHTVGGQLLICAANDVDCGSIQQVTGSGFVFTGQPGGNNGNIVLQANSNSTFASVFIPTARVDRPGLIIADANGSATSKAIELASFAGVDYFTIQQATGALAIGRTGITDSFNANKLVFSLIDSSGNVRIQGSNGGVGGGTFTTSDAAGVVVNTMNASGIKSTTLASGSPSNVCATTAGLLSISGCPAGASSPFTDATAIMFNAADPTKLLKFALGGFPTASTRTLTPQPFNYTLAGTDISQIFTADQSFDTPIHLTSSGATQWTFSTISTNVIGFRDSGANLRVYFDASGVAGNGVFAALPSVQVAPTNAVTPAMQVGGFGSGSADLFSVSSNLGGTKKLWVNSSGNVLVADLTSGTTSDVCATAAGVLTISGCPSSGGFTAGAWTPYTPTTSGFSSVTSTNCAYNQFSKSVMVRCRVTGVSNGGTASLTLPFTGVADQAFTCVVGVITTIPCTAGFTASTATVQMPFYTNTAPTNGTTYVYVLQGVYETT